MGAGRLLTAVACVCAAAAPAAAAELRYIEPGSEHQYAVLTAPLPAEAIGQSAIEALRMARSQQDGRDYTDEAPAPVEAESAAAAPAADLPWHSAAAAPFGAGRPKDGKPPTGFATALGTLETEKVAAVYLKR